MVFEPGSEQDCCLWRLQSYCSVTNIEMYSGTFAEKGVEIPMLPLCPTPNPLPCILLSYFIWYLSVSFKLVELPEILFFISPNLVEAYLLCSTFVINSDKIYSSFCLLNCVLLISQLLDSYWVDQSLFPLKSEPLPWLVSPTSKQLKSLVDIENTLPPIEYRAIKSNEMQTIWTTFIFEYYC